MENFLSQIEQGEELENFSSKTKQTNSSTKYWENWQFIKKITHWKLVKKELSKQGVKRRKSKNALICNLLGEKPERGEIKEFSAVMVTLP